MKVGIAMNIDEIIELDKKYHMNTFGNRIPICFDHGKGMTLWDTNGKAYLDLYGGIAVSALGHAHPALVSTIIDQAEKLIHCSSLYYIEAQAKLAKLLVDNSCADKIFFGNSGAEANEGAIKLAKIYFKKKNLPNKFEIITLKNSFHGRTLATLTATGQEKFHTYLTPLMPGFKYAPINDLDALAKTVTDSTCAIMLELIQGESGVNPVTLEYIKGVKKICDVNGLLLIIDEIQTGIGRTGKLFAYENYGVEPDIFTLAKGLAGGVPIGAICAKDEVARAFDPGDHGSTFGGNPLACSAGIAVIETILKDGLVENAHKVGNYFIESLKTISKKYPLITEIRGMGLMIGVQLAQEKALDIKNELMGLGFLVGNVGSSIIRMLPPLIISKQDVDSFIDAFDKVLSKC